MICGRMNRVIARVSRPVGALRLTRQFLRHDPPRRSELRRMSEYIDDKITPVAGQLSADNVPYLIGTASSVAALVCHLRLVERWRRSAADGQSVTLGEVEGFLRKLAVMDLRRRRRLIGIGRRRAEIIIAGVAVIQRVMIACQLDELRYCTASVADGIIAHFATAAGKGVGAKEELHNVFLSYNSQDKPAVRRIARQLEDQGIVPFFDERDILPGKLWRSKVLQTVKAIPAAAVFIGPHGVGESQRDEIDALLEAAASFDRPIVPVLLPGADVSQIPSTLRERARVNFNNRGASPLRQLVSGVIPLE